MNLDYVWLQGLKSYLTTENHDHPPQVLVPDPADPDGPYVLQNRPLAIIQVGRFLEDPQEAYGVLSLHLGDREDPKWWHERDIHQKAEGGGTGYQAFGGQMEIGGGTFYWFRYSAELQLFYTLEGYEQELALAHATEAIHWTLKRLNMRTARALGVGKVDGLKPEYQTAESFKPEERGGTNMWIWYCKFHMQLRVHADAYALSA